jgi:L-lysine 2,3-aminomutase
MLDSIAMMPKAPRLPIQTSRSKISDSPIPARWKTELKSAIRSPRVLGEYLGLEESFIAAAEALSLDRFPILVPMGFAARMRRGDPTDPLLLQVWPTARTIASSEFTADPVGDLESIVANGLLHKYVGRVLMITTGACAIHCRYCFRQNFPYSDAPHSIVAWQPAIDYIAADESIHEVILSGGDPLTLVDSTLSDLIEAIEAISHVKRLRIHTRLPIVIPSRVDRDLIRWLSVTRLSKWIVIHSNHANELNDDVADALKELRKAGCSLLNQCVLLRGINASVEAQYALCERLIDIGVMPYYLNQLDRVEGTEHFEVEASDGQRLIEELRKRLPGYGVPSYVREIAGQPNKVPVR